MALLSKKEFADRFNISTRYLSNYIRRGKVIVGKNDQIDDTLQSNVEFAARHADKKTGKAAPPAEKKEKPGKKSSADRKALAAQEKKTTLLYDLDKEKKATEIETNKKRNELLTMELAKKSGKLIPTSDVKNLFAQHSKSITVSFGQFIENFISQIAQRVKLNKNQVAEIRGEMITMLNQSVDDAVNNTKVSIENLHTQVQNASKP